MATDLSAANPSRSTRRQWLASAVLATCTALVTLALVIGPYSHARGQGLLFAFGVCSPVMLLRRWPLPLPLPLPLPVLAAAVAANALIMAAGIAALSFGGAGSAGSPPEPLSELIAAIRDPAARRDLRRMLDTAGLDRPVLIDAEIAALMARPYSWLLDRVGADGIKLTGAGYLPPAHVEAAVAALGLGKEWIGKGNREVQTLPVLHLRESATKMGLLRKHRGMLLATSRGRALRADPAGLWWHLAERMPPRSADRCEVRAGLLLLAAVAAQVTGDVDAIVARMLGAIGWIASDGTELTRSMAAHAGWDTKTVLRRLGGFSSDRYGLGPGQPTPEGITFARAALRTWPS